jgi:hypothetical protein
VVAPWFGVDAADLLAMDNAMSPDVTASIANDAAKLAGGVSPDCRRLPHGGGCCRG